MVVKLICSLLAIFFLILHGIGGWGSDGGENCTVVLLRPSTVSACVEVQICSKVGLTGREPADRRSSSIASPSVCTAPQLVSWGFWACWRIQDSWFRNCCNKMVVLFSWELWCERLALSSCEVLVWEDYKWETKQFTKGNLFPVAGSLKCFRWDFRAATVREGIWVLDVPERL